MTIVLHRFLLASVGLAAATSAASPAIGQTDRAIVMTILGECAKIGDVVTRTACFDNNIGLAGPPAQAPAGIQDPATLNRNVAINILAECAKIGDAPARVSCYDNNIRVAGSAVAAPISREGQSQSGSNSALANPGGSTTRPAPARPELRASTPGNPRPLQGFGVGASETTRITATVASATERRPGAYLVTLQDGAQWEFVEDVRATYEAPARGSTVEIERGPFGNFLLRFDRQRPVRVQRVR